MTDTDDARRHDIALFRYGVIADLAHWPKERKGLYAKLAQKAAQPIFNTPDYNPF